MAVLETIIPRVQAICTFLGKIGHQNIPLRWKSLNHHEPTSCTLGVAGEVLTIGQYEKKNSLAVVGYVSERDKQDLAKQIVHDPHSPNDLLTSAFLRFNIKITDYLKDDYQLVFWDENKQELFCVNGPRSKHPFYFYHSAKGLLFSNFLPHLRNTLPQKLLLNHKKLANLLALHNPEHIESFYNDIKTLPGGHSLIYKKNKMRIQQYWQPDKLRNVIKTRDKIEIYHTFKETLAQVITDKTKQHKTVASELSGGLDSSTIAAITAKILQNKHENLLCYSNTSEKNFQFPTKKSKNLHDHELLTSLQKQFNNIVIKHVLCTETSFSLKDTAPFCYDYSDGPMRNPCNATWLYQIYEMAAKQGASLLLNGSIGNMTISFNGKKPLSKTKKNIKDLFKNKEQYIKQLSKFSALRPDLAKEILKKQSIMNISRFSQVNIRELTQLVHRTNLQMDSFRSGLEIYHQISSYDPSNDIDVIALCYNLPNSIYYRKKESRRLIRDAMKGLLPQSILLNKQLGEQHPDWFYQLRKDMPFFQDLLPKFKQNDTINQLIDLNDIEKLMKEISVYDPFSHDIHTTTTKFRYKLTRALHIAHWIYLHD